MLEKSEIISILNTALGQTARLRKGGTELVYKCPTCSHSTKKKLEVCLDETSKFFGGWHCWTCNSSGNLGKLLKISNASSSLRSELSSILKNVKIIKRDIRKSPISELELPEEFHPLSIPLDSLEYRHALNYVKNRGILREDILRYNIGYCESGPYEYHVIIPSYDANGKLNFFLGRHYYDNPEVISYKKPNTASMNIVGFEAHINYNEPLILVEGCFNAITIRRNAIPLYGKFPSKKLQEAMIINGVKKVYVFLDSDARRESIKLCDRLVKMGITSYFVDIKDKMDGKDANEIGFEKSWECIKNAKEFDFAFKLRNGLDNK